VAYSPEECLLSQNGEPKFYRFDVSEGWPQLHPEGQRLIPAGQIQFVDGRPTLIVSLDPNQANAVPSEEWEDEEGNKHCTVFPKTVHVVAVPKSAVKEEKTDG
jgi:hypothetical protein